MKHATSARGVQFATRFRQAKRSANNLRAAELSVEWLVADLVKDLGWDKPAAELVVLCVPNQRCSYVCYRHSHPQRCLYKQV
jgi:hypothetical protein